MLLAAGVAIELAQQVLRGSRSRGALSDDVFVRKLFAVQVAIPRLVFAQGGTLE